MPLTIDMSNWLSFNSEFHRPVTSGVSGQISGVRVVRPVTSGVRVVRPVNSGVGVVSFTLRQLHESVTSHVESAQ